MASKQHKQMMDAKREPQGVAAVGIARHESWRTTLAAARRVIDHHKSTLDARVSTVQASLSSNLRLADTGN